MQLTIGQFISQQRGAVAPVIERDSKGKTAIVTGANNGIGMETAKHFAKMNPGKLILACRSKERGRLLSKIKKETGCETIELWILDLGEFASVKAFAEKFDKEGGGRLDILVENAAILPSEKFEATPDGWESSLQVNHLSTSLLALLLLPYMVKTVNTHGTMPRIVVVSSEVHYWAKIDKAILEASKPLKLYGSSKDFTPKSFWNLQINKTQANRYAETKLMNIFFVRALSERLQAKAGRIVVDAVNPGYCYSGLRANFSGARAWFDWFMEKALARTAEEGSRQVVWAALGGEEGGNGDAAAMRGAYVSNAQITEPSDYVIGEEGRKAQDKLWDNLVEELGKVDGEVENIVKEYLTLPPKKELDPLPETVFQGI